MIFTLPRYFHLRQVSVQPERGGLVGICLTRSNTELLDLSLQLLCVSRYCHLGWGVLYHVRCGVKAHHTIAGIQNKRAVIAPRSGVLID